MNKFVCCHNECSIILAPLSLSSILVLSLVLNHFFMSAFWGLILRLSNLSDSGESTTVNTIREDQYNFRDQGAANTVWNAAQLA